MQLRMSGAAILSYEKVKMRAGFGFRARDRIDYDGSTIALAIVL
jgi:hypothetical protein